jgi:hypothetical protein
MGNGVKEDHEFKASLRSYMARSCLKKKRQQGKYGGREKGREGEKEGRKEEREREKERKKKKERKKAIHIRECKDDK